MTDKIDINQITGGLPGRGGAFGRLPLRREARAGTNKTRSNQTGGVIISTGIGSSWCPPPFFPGSTTTTTPTTGTDRLGQPLHGGRGDAAGLGPLHRAGPRGGCVSAVPGHVWWPWVLGWRAVLRPLTPCLVFTHACVYIRVGNEKTQGCTSSAGPTRRRGSRCTRSRTTRRRRRATGERPQRRKPQIPRSDDVTP